MHVQFPVELDGRTVVVSEEVETEADLFKFLSSMQEIFSGSVCERNGSQSPHVKCRVRKDDDENEYFEFFCYKGDKECFGAVKRFGQNKKGGGLFPKSKDREGNWLPNNGWMKWNKDTQKEE